LLSITVNRYKLEIKFTNGPINKLPNAMFELGVHHEGQEDKEKIGMEFTHDELYRGY
jgi:hypothetical protein